MDRRLVTRKSSARALVALSLVAVCRCGAQAGIVPQVGARFERLFFHDVPRDTERVDPGTIGFSQSWRLTVSDQAGKAQVVPDIGFVSPVAFSQCKPKASQAAKSSTEYHWKNVKVPGGGQARVQAELTGAAILRTLPYVVEREWTPKILTTSGDVRVTVRIKAPETGGRDGAAMPTVFQMAIGLAGRNETGQDLVDIRQTQGVFRFAELAHVAASVPVGQDGVVSLARIDDPVLQHYAWSFDTSASRGILPGQVLCEVTCTVHFALRDGVQAATVYPLVTLSQPDPTFVPVWTDGKLDLLTAGNRVEIKGATVTPEAGNTDWVDVRFYHEHSSRAAPAGESGKGKQADDDLRGHQFAAAKQQFEADLGDNPFSVDANLMHAIAPIVSLFDNPPPGIQRAMDSFQVQYIHDLYAPDHQFEAGDKETYADLNINGEWDPGEPFTDMDGDGEYDERLIPVGAMAANDVVDTIIADLGKYIGSASINLSTVTATADNRWNHTLTRDMVPPAITIDSGDSVTLDKVDCLFAEAGLYGIQFFLQFLQAYDLNLRWNDIQRGGRNLTQGDWDAHPAFLTQRNTASLMRARHLLKAGGIKALQAIELILGGWDVNGGGGFIVTEGYRAGNRSDWEKARDCLVNGLNSLDEATVLEFEDYDPLTLHLGRLFSNPVNRSTAPTIVSDVNNRIDWETLPDPTFNGVFPTFAKRANFYAAYSHYLDGSFAISPTSSFYGQLAPAEVGWGKAFAATSFGDLQKYMTHFVVLRRDDGTGDFAQIFEADAGPLNEDVTAYSWFSLPDYRGWLFTDKNSLGTTSLDYCVEAVFASGDGGVARGRTQRVSLQSTDPGGPGRGERGPAPSAITVEPGWNLVGLPPGYSQFSIGALFGSAFAGQVFALDPETKEYVALSNDYCLPEGLACWVRAVRPATLTFPWCAAAPSGILLAPGWNVVPGVAGRTAAVFGGQGVVWTWDAVAQQYRPVASDEPLSDTRGYLVRAFTTMLVGP